MKHTKTPWILDNLTNIYSDDATGSIVATVSGFKWVYRSQEEMEANAAFIVKAVNNFYTFTSVLDRIIAEDDIEKVKYYAREALSKVQND